MDCNRLHSVSRTIAQSLVVILAAFLFLPPQPARADDLFDPARHMRISEIKPGMRGYGLTVMRGTAIERFEVEVLSILHNFNPQGDVILVRCSGLDLEHTGAIAGMSGSPIYLDDGSGNARMAGAFAYGWQLMKDPVGGVQPVEYMLKLPAEVRTPATQPAKNNTASTNTTRWNVAEAMSLPYSKDKAVQPLKARQGTSPQVDTSRLRPLLTPLMVSGLSQPQIDRLSDLLGVQGMATLQAGGTSTAPADLDPADAAVKLEPGSAIAVPLVTGDLDLTAIGTVTEVIGNRVYGFGHPFNSEGDVKLPMGTGRIHGVIANYMTSFKLGSMIQATGTLASDQMVGIAGTVGAVPETIPLELRVIYDDGSLDKTYHFQVSSHPLLTPRLLPGVAATVVTAQHELPVHHSVDSDIVIDFEGGRQVTIRSKSAGMSIMPMYFNLAGAIATAADNPFETVLPVKMHGTVRIASTTNEAHILSVNVPRTEYRPGQSVRAFITYRPFRSDEKTMPVEMELPRDLPDGDYTLTISDAYSYLSEEQSLAPYRFTAEDIDEVFDVIHDITSIDESAIYIRLLRQQDGVAIGRTALPHLPSSRQQVLLGAGRSNMTPLVSSTVKQIPTDVLMSGAVQFQIKVNRNARIDTASATSQPTPATTAAGSN